MAVTPQDTNDRTIISVVDRLLLRASAERASDIHIEPSPDATRLRFRIDGVLVERPSFTSEQGASIASRLKIMSQLDISEKRLPQDGAFEFSVNNQQVPFRVATFPTEYGEKVVVRVLSRADAALSIERLGVGPEHLDTLRRVALHQEGIVLVTGPTGAGKTTTMYALLHELENKTRNIMTLEDPIEYRFESIIQGQVNPKIGFSFARGLKAILRQDPDVIMVGEMRDVETAEIAFRAALTGHLVFSSLHTNSVVDSFVRLFDMGLERFVVASALRAVIAQRLVRRLCLNCSRQAPISALKRTLLGLTEADEDLKAYEPVGCDDCNQTGYFGRVGLYEILEIDDVLADLLKSQTLSRQAIKDELASREVQSLREAGRSQVLKGATSIDEVLRVT